MISKTFPTCPKPGEDIWYQMIPYQRYQNSINVTHVNTK